MKKPLAIILACFFIFGVLGGCQKSREPLKWHQRSGYSWAAVNPGHFEQTGMKKLDPSRTGIDFKAHITQEEVNENQILINGTGVTTGDIDNDGLVDIYFAQLNGPNKLYRNLGNFRFRDVTKKAGVGHTGNYSRGVLFADVDGDSDQDLLVSTVDGENALYINDGKGVFSHKEDSGLKKGQGSTTMTMADIDSDRDLDLFVANNKQKPVYDLFSKQQLQPRNLVKRPEEKQVPGKTQYEFKEPFHKYYRFIYRKNKRAMMEEKGERNRLYLNDGKGNFTDVSDEKGRFINADGETAEWKREWSLTARFEDLNGDRLPDLYVCNDYFGPDRFWINQGNGRFREISSKGIRNFSYSAMGIGVSDINRDGTSDIFVTEMLSPVYKRQARQFQSTDMRPAMIREKGYQPQNMRNSLYLNRGDNTFAEIAYYSGLEASEWSWATTFMDLDLDGYEDLLINTGYPYDAIDMDYSYNSSRYKGAVNLSTSPQLRLGNKIFRNNGDTTFKKKSSDWGFKEKDISYGMATADFDNDGDLDMVNTKFDSPAGVYQNKGTAPRIAVTLKGKSPNTGAVGAEVILEGGPVRQSKQVVSGGDYLSGSVHYLVFAAKAENKSHTLRVRWPSGGETVIDSVAANRIYRISQPENTSEKKERIKEESESGLFRDASSRLNHTHEDKSFNDWKLQPLLPLKLSQRGPGLLWMDYDGDKDEDLFIAGGSGDPLNVYENHNNGAFKEKKLQLEGYSKSFDQSAVIGWETERYTRILVGISNYEYSEKNRSVPSVLIYDITPEGEVSRQTISGISSTTGSLSSADYDRDGDLDLFVGGRTIPGKYPRNATSRLFVNENGRFIPDKTNNSLLQEIGLTTSSTFSDMDQDGDPDLLLSREWGSLVILENRNGSFRDISRDMGLDNYKGWWNSIATGDFNNDGKPDLLATNMGLNSPYQIRNGKPLKLYHSDFDMNQREDILDVKYSSSLDAYVPRRKLYQYQPFQRLLTTKFRTFKDYAKLTMDELLDTSLDKLPGKEINTLQHMVFLNKGGRFKAKPLHSKAQLSMGFDTRIADFNSDGKEDLFLSQNFFGTPPEIPRMDAGRGLLLKGDGSGDFEPMSAGESGLKLYGQQRGSAVGDVNGDGKPDLAVGQNDSTTKLFINQTARRGIAVQLVGGAKNRQGIGSSLRMVYADGSKGPLREIKGGAGYWSQNSTTQILGIRDSGDPERILIHWNDGTSQNQKIKDGIWEYVITKNEK